jgi:hypothetical protein
MMSERIELTAEPVSLRMFKGETAETGITLRNRGQTVDQFTINIEGLDPEWYTLPVSSVALFPNDQDIVKVVFTLPEDIDPGVDAYPIIVKAISQENPQDISTTELNIEIGKAPKISLNLSPERLSGRRGAYTVTASNPGSRECSVQLKGNSPKGRVFFNFQPDKLTIPAGGTLESTLNVRLSRLALILWERTYDFEVSAEQTDGMAAETIRQNGQLVSVPWYRFLSRLRIPWLSRPPAIKSFESKTDDNREYLLKWQVQKSSNVQLDGSDVEAQGSSLVTPIHERRYVLTATNKYGVTTRAIEVKPLAAPTARISDKIKVTVTPPQLQTKAGLVPAQAFVQVQNLSNIVDKFVIEVEGLDGSWYTRSASSIALMPQATDQVQITFLPPDKKGVKAGIYDFAITVHSQTTAGESTSVLGKLEILSSVQYKLRVHPYRVFGMRKGACNLAIANTGVSGAKISIEASDLDDGCKIEIKPDSLTLGAWNTVEVPIVIRPKRNSFFGAAKRYDITLTASSEGGMPQTANCEFNHSPFIKSWKPIFRVIRAIIGIALVVIAVILVINWGGGWEAIRESPKDWFNNIIYSVESWFK